MNEAELVSHVAAETSSTRAAAERMVDAVFSAIADALARDQPAAIAGFGKFAVRSRVARKGRNPRTGDRSSSRRRRRRRSSRRKPFATRSTNSMMWGTVACSPSVSATRPPHVRTINTQTCKTSFAASRRSSMHFPSRAIAPQSIHTRLVTEGLPRQCRAPLHFRRSGRASWEITVATTSRRTVTSRNPFAVTAPSTLHSRTASILPELQSGPCQQTLTGVWTPARRAISGLVGSPEEIEVHLAMGYANGSRDDSQMWAPSETVDRLPPTGVTWLHHD